MKTLSGSITATPSFDSESSIAVVPIKVLGARKGMAAVASFDQTMAFPNNTNPSCFVNAQVIADDLVQVSFFWWSGGDVEPVFTNLWIGVTVFAPDCC